MDCLVQLYQDDGPDDSSGHAAQTRVAIAAVEHLAIAGELHQKSRALEAEIEAHRQTRATLARREQELRIFKEEGRSADRRHNELLAMLGHELRNPLSPILSALEVLRIAGANTSAARHAQDAIGHQTRHLARIVDDLLDASRINTGRIILRRERVDLARAIQCAIDETRELIAVRRHRLAVNLPAAGTIVEGDATRLQQIFGNLLENAARYMDPDGSIAVDTCIAGRHVRVTVEDRGCGIDPQLLPRIFDLFSQADRPLDRAHGGLGIGLWMVRKLVELHHGTVEVASGGRGQGSRFTVSLPFIDAPSAGEEDPDNSTQRDGSHRAARILVVDDNQDGADLLAVLLRLDGHVVQAAHDGLAGLAAAQSFDPDIVLLDIGLPGLDGYSVARRLREVGGRRRCLIAMTGYGTDEDRQRTRDAGFDHHIVKPVEPAELNQLVARSLAELGV